MEAKQYFRQVRSEQKEIQRLREAIDLKYGQLLPKAIRYDKDNIQTSVTDYTSEILTSIADYIAKLEKLTAKLEAKRSEALSMVTTLDKSKERDVMRLYYLETDTKGNLYTWDGVADKMGYSTETVLKAHGNALEELKKFFEKIEKST